MKPFKRSSISKTYSSRGSKWYEFGIDGLLVQLQYNKNINEVRISFHNPKIWPTVRGSDEAIFRVYQIEDIDLTKRNEVKDLIVSFLNKYVTENSHYLIKRTFE